MIPVRVFSCQCTMHTEKVFSLSGEDVHFGRRKCSTLPVSVSRKNGIFIDRIDSTAVDYYRTASVSFADEGKIINFDDEAEKVYSAIRDRIYATRNAIVHSKHGERLRYEPFKHDKQLAKEIPLIRAVAEEIIINSAERINYNFVDAQQTPPQ